MKTRLLLAALVAIAACNPGPPTASAEVGSLEIRGGFAYEPIIPASGAAYLQVYNRGPLADTLLEASSPAAAEVMIHGTPMRLVHPLQIAPEETLKFEPGGLHLMFSEFSHPPRAGDSVALTLHFVRAGFVTLRLPVRRYGE